MTILKTGMIKLLSLLILMAGLSCNNNTKPGEAKQNEKNWTLLPFSKVDSVNPVLLPGSVLTFNCPVRKETVRWEEKDVFNPAVDNISVNELTFENCYINTMRGIMRIRNNNVVCKNFNIVNSLVDSI
jgi:hypothetical protein